MLTHVTYSCVGFKAQNVEFIIVLRGSPTPLLQIPVWATTQLYEIVSPFLYCKPTQ